MLLRRDWYEIASRARKLGFSLRLFTNGSTVDEEKADLLKTLYANVEVSLYSMDGEIFERVPQRAGERGAPQDPDDGLQHHGIRENPRVRRADRGHGARRRPHRGEEERGPGDAEAAGGA